MAPSQSSLSPVPLIVTHETGNLSPVYNPLGTFKQNPSFYCSDFDFVSVGRTKQAFMQSVPLTDRQMSVV